MADTTDVTRDDRRTMDPRRPEGERSVPRPLPEQDSFHFEITRDGIRFGANGRYAIPIGAVVAVAVVGLLIAMKHYAW